MSRISLRDYFAAEAMPLALVDYRHRTLGLSEPIASWEAKDCLSRVASDAYKLADAMLEARENNND